MTRHGTLAYYLAAWIIACPVVALFYWLIGVARTRSASSSALFEICFFALMAGAADSLLFALLVRRLMHSMDARNIGIWSLAGAALSLALVSLLSMVSYRLRDSANGAVTFVNTFLLAGPGAIWSLAWWQVPFEGAGLGAVLGLIDRAFNRASIPEAAAGPTGQSATVPTSYT